MKVHNLAKELMARLPLLRGKLLSDVPMHEASWFRVGGPAEVMFRPADAEDLAYFLRNTPHAIPLTIIGLTSNLLIRDGGIPGIVIKLGKEFADISIEDGHRIRAGAALPDVKVARAAADAGIAGLSFLRGIPGAIGGAIRMNGGAYGAETSDVLIEVKAVSRGGEFKTLSNADMGFSYRHSDVQDDLIFVEALFQGSVGDSEAIRAEMNDITDAREETQPVNSRTGGSTFKNPPDKKAWELIDAAGCRGLQIGGAQVSEKHCNFLINTGEATAADLEALGEEVRSRVKAHCGVELEWEIRRVGISMTDGL